MSFPMPPAVITQEYPLASNTHYDLADRRIVVANDAYPAGALRARGIANVSLRFGILDGAIFGHATWTEHSHLLLLENVVNARIEQVDFQNPIGDHKPLPRRAIERGSRQRKFNGRSPRVRLRHNAGKLVARNQIAGAIEAAPDDETDGKYADDQ